MTESVPEHEAAAIRAALARVAASEAFRNAPQLSAFLTFVVEKALAGAAGDIKGYTIATQALGRGPDFDPQGDPIVRVEAGRLRRALHAYYHSDGEDDPLRIVIPRGAYVPRFMPRPTDIPAAEETSLEPPEEAAPAPAAAEVVLDAPSPPAAPPPATVRSPWRIAVPALLLIGAGALILLTLPEARPPDGAQRPQNARVLPTQAFSTDLGKAEGRAIVMVAPIESAGPASPHRFSPEAFRDLVVDGLARFDEVAVVDQPLARDRGEVERYVVNLRAGEVGGEYTIVVRLTHRPSGEVVWSRAFDAFRRETTGATPELDAARQIATIVAQPYGVLFSDLRRRPTTSARLRCTLMAYDYWQNPSAGAHAQARDCLETELAAQPASPTIPANLSFLVLDEYRAGYKARSEETPPLERALRLARRAVELGPQSARAHQALMAAHFTRGEFEQSQRSGQRAFELNPFDTDILADLGARQVQRGFYKEGADMIARAAAGNPSEPPWYDFFLFLAHYMQGDMTAAAAASARLTTNEYPLGLVARAIVAKEQGDAAQARALMERLVAVQPEYARDPRAVIAKRRFTPEATERLVTALRAAGLSSTLVGR